MTTIEDRAKLISDLVHDAVARQLQDAVLTDPVRAHLAGFLFRDVDGVYLNGPDGAASAHISKEEYGGVGTSELSKLMAGKRAEMRADAAACLPASEHAAMQAKIQAEAEEG